MALIGFLYRIILFCLFKILMIFSLISFSMCLDSVMQVDLADLHFIFFLRVGKITTNN